MLKLKQIIAFFLLTNFLFASTPLANGQSIVPASEVRFKQQGSAPSAPSATFTDLYIDSSGVAHLLQSNSTNTTLAQSSNNLSFFASTSSAQLAGILSDETGTNKFVLSDSPVLVTPTLGAALATSINGLTLTSSTGTFTLTNGKVFSVANTLSFSGTDGSSVAFGAGGTVLYSTSTIGIANGGTGQTTQTAAFNALSPLTTSGDIIYFNGTNNVRLAKGSDGDVLTLASGLPSWAASGGGGGLSFSGSPSDNAVLKKTGVSTVGASSFTDSGTIVSFGTTVNAQRFLLYEDTNTKHGWGLAASEMRFFSPTGSKTTFGILSTADGSTYTEKLSITATELNLTGSSQNLLMAGAGDVLLTNASNQIDFGTGANTQQILYYHDTNTKAGVGLGTGVVRHFVGNDGTSIHSFGTVSTSDGSTYAQQYYIGQSANDHTASGHNELFSGGGGISFNGVAPLSNSRIDLKDTVKSQAILIYSDGSNNRHGFGVASNQTRIFSPTGSYTSIGNISTSDGTTWTEYYRFNESGKLDITQGTITSSLPFVNHTATLNSGGTTFTIFKSNTTDTASASATMLMDLQVGGTTEFNVRKDGKGYFAGNIGAGVASPSVIINAFDSPTAGTLIQSAGFLSSVRTGQVGFHMYNNGGVAEWIVTQPASGTSSNFQINTVVSNVQYNQLEITTSGVTKTKSLTQTVVAAGNSGTSFTLDWNNGGVQQITLTGNVTSITLSNPVAGARYVIYFATGAGSFTVTGWPASVKWPSGVAPTVTVTASKTDKIVLDYDGTNYYGEYQQNYYGSGR